jgi:hypothetical protein
MDIEEALTIYKSLSPAQRYYIKHREEKKKKALDRYWAKIYEQKRRA